MTCQNLGHGLGSINGISVDDTDFSCLDVRYAQYVDIADGSFTNCGMTGETSRQASTLRLEMKPSPATTWRCRRQRYPSRND